MSDVSTTINNSFDENMKITKCIWTIHPDYVKKFTDLPNTKRIKSDYFKTDQNLQWFITCYPDGNKHDNKGNCMLFVGLKSMLKYKSIKVYYYIRCVESNTCLDGFDMFVKDEDAHGSNSAIVLTAELTKYSSISFEIGIRVLIITKKNNDIKYRYSLPISEIKKNIQLKWNINQQLLNSFKTAHQGKRYITGALLSDQNHMFSTSCYPNGYEPKYEGYLALYLLVCAFPTGVESMKIKFTMTCAEVNKSKSYTHIFSWSNFGYGFCKYCSFEQLSSLSSLNIIC
eukprot:209323_1